MQREPSANESVYPPQVCRWGLYIEVVKLRTWRRRRAVIVLQARQTSVRLLLRIIARSKIGARGENGLDWLACRQPTTPATDWATDSDAVTDRPVKKATCFRFVSSACKTRPGCPEARHQMAR